MTANAVQYIWTVYLSLILGIGMVKYAVMRLTGMKSIVTLASSIVMRVKRSTALDCLIAIRLKFYNDQRLCIRGFGEAIPEAPVLPFRQGTLGFRS